MQRLYVDHAATSPLKAEVKKAYVDALDIVGNPSSLHQDGRQVRMRVEMARAELAQCVGADPSEIIFTSGGTEADNLAIKGLYRAAQKEGKTTILVAGIEHPAVLDCIEYLEDFEDATIIWIPVDHEGIVDVAFIEKTLQQHHAEIALVSVMWANNEVGTVQAIADIAAVCQKYNVACHSDAVQALGSEKINFSQTALTAMTISSHKIGGPLGIGALVLARSATPVPVLHGGGQERSVRSGTLDTPAIVGFAKAATLAGENSEQLKELRDYFISEVEKLEGVKLAGSRQNRLANNAHFTFEGCEGDSLLFLLDHQGISSSTGSACTAGVPRPSHVLLAMGYSEDAARGVQRFTFGPEITRAEIDRILDVLPSCYEQAKKAGLASHVPTIR
ncbi:MAG: cysteine desulfurase family protein [Micrococcaceae bacterium]